MYQLCDMSEFNLNNRYYWKILKGKKRKLDDTFYSFYGIPILYSSEYIKLDSIKLAKLLYE